MVNKENYPISMAELFMTGSCISGRLVTYYNIPGIPGMIDYVSLMDTPQQLWIYRDTHESQPFNIRVPLRTIVK